jgi:hypothetical protein
MVPGRESALAAGAVGDVVQFYDIAVLRACEVHAARWAAAGRARGRVLMSPGLDQGSRWGEPAFAWTGWS